MTKEEVFQDWVVNGLVLKLPEGQFERKMNESQYRKLVFFFCLL